jgi:hypothetical protein
MDPEYVSSLERSIDDTRGAWVPLVLELASREVVERYQVFGDEMQDYADVLAQKPIELDLARDHLNGLNIAAAALSEAMAAHLRQLEHAALEAPPRPERPAKDHR